MSDKIKNIVVTVTFLGVLVLFFLINLCREKEEISYTERRKLATFPTITLENLLEGKFNKEFEQYTTDQMLQRENFRKLKAMLELNLFKKKDNNGIYEYQGSLIKIEYPLNENSVLNAVEKIKTIQKNELGNSKCYYAIVPDKNYFTNPKEYIRMDYEKMQTIMQQNLPDMEFINLFDCLELQDYYITDIHWKQENLSKVVEKIATKMNFRNRIQTKFISKDITDFEGIYAGQLGKETKKDKISIATNEIIEKAKVYHYENGKETKIYDSEKLDSKDKYDIYLSGSTPLITITNPKATTNQELIVFRDSFASSLVPLLTEAYAKITLVDIRYMRSEDVGKYIEFNDQDVLFLYSTIVLNNSSILR